MSTIDTSTEALNAYGLNSSSEIKTEKDQDQFMTMLLAQVKHQDPMSPMDNSEFIAQLAAIETATGLSDLQKSFDSFASSMQSSQALQASTLVGRSVLVPSNSGILNSDGVLEGQVALERSTEKLTVEIYSSAGNLVKTIDMGMEAKGISNFSWDGVGNDGQTYPPGSYYVQANARVDGKQEAQPVYAAGNVDSVTLDSSGSDPILNLNGLGTIRFSEVVQIM